MGKSLSWKLMVGIIFLSAQLFRLGYIRFSDYHFFSWMPHDIQTEYYLDVYVNGQSLGVKELHQRYNIKPHGWMDVSPHYLINWMEQYEKSHSKAATDSINLRYEVNGNGWNTWTWSKHKDGVKK